jgi:CRISPR-associated endonuclease/helicase Cas3
VTFREFFQKATQCESEPDGRIPYPYQERFAEAEQLFQLVRAPTGAGKTATAILGWLWRHLHSSKLTPRRLVYCLPMRVLVEQSERETRGWIKNLGLSEQVEVHVLMGGVDVAEWYLYPENPAVLLGTQDMLLSRALNRGYGASRFHWPIDFGLLNNDCVWVFDEPQLMGSGVSTSAQLAGLRAALGTFSLCPSIWMSATLEPAWLDTVDFRNKRRAQPLELDEEDYDPSRPLYKRMTAEKALAPLGALPTKDGREVAAAVVDRHAPGSQTLVVLNTVERAKAVYAAIKRHGKAPKNVLLVHSRFRPHERQRLNEQLQERGETAVDRIIVATQVVEAGVDISARTLVTELAPWASLVQRMGRCNRTGDDGPGRVFWVDLDTDKQAAPYEGDDVAFGRAQLEKLDGKDLSPKALDDFKRREGITLPFEHSHVMRRRDLLDLFDMAPDLSGNDIEVSRFVRGDDAETDAQVFWRELDGNGPPADLPAPDRRELCAVPVGKALREFLSTLREKKKLAAYVWDHLDEAWVRLEPRQVRPGLTILLPAASGGYSELGWDPGSPGAVVPVPHGDAPPEEGTSDDPNSAGPPLTIAEHTGNVRAELDEALGQLKDSLGGWAGHLALAAQWHDAGKGHPVFQASVHRVNPGLSRERRWAKSGVRKPLRHSRKYFRHELVSALAALQHGLRFEVVYLIATHHGKVRLSIRALPGEEPPDPPGTLFALGVHDHDELPAVALGGEVCPAMVLDLSPMRMGGEASWTANSLRLRDEVGPFRLAYLEALLRAADLRASAKEQKGASHA